MLTLAGWAAGPTAQRGELHRHRRVALPPSADVDREPNPSLPSESQSTQTTNTVRLKESRPFTYTTRRKSAFRTD